MIAGPAISGRRAMEGAWLIAAELADGPNNIRLVRSCCRACFGSQGGDLPHPSRSGLERARKTDIQDGSHQSFVELRRRKGDWSGNCHLAPLDRDFENAASFVGAATAKRREFEAEGRLSPKGVAEAVQEFVGGGMNGELKRIRKCIGETEAAIAERRKALARPKIDKTDAAAAALRVQVRDFLRGAGTDGQAKALLGANPDPLFIEAVLEAPEALSGVPTQMREQAIARHVEVHHAADLRDIEAAEEGLAVLRAVVTAAENDVRDATRPAAA